MSEIIAYKITQIIDNGNVIQMTLIEDVQTELEEALVRAYENIVTPFLKEQYKEFDKK